MAYSLWQAAFVLFPVLALLHLNISPFTKVEESFNMQAIHDILTYGVPLSNAPQKLKMLYDHMTFPGAVPRTFIGSLVVSGFAMPEHWFGELMGQAAQRHARSVLGCLNAIALIIFAKSVERSFGPITAAWYVALQASQFHLWYYASRTLPNMFAFFLSTIALACLLPSPSSTLRPLQRTKLGLYLLTIATAIFRSELAILLVAHCAWLFLKPQTLDAKIALVGGAFGPSIIPGALLGVLLTVSIDTYFWQSSTWLWPELSAFMSNVFPSKDSQGASAWGTQPFYWYLVVALPRLLMNQIVMVDLFFAFPQTLIDTRILDNLIPSYAYVLIYSILPHKETRFMFPVVPSLTLVAALTCTRLTINMHKAVFNKILFYLAVGSTVITAFISHAVLLPLSAQNYPGGHSLEALHQYYQENYQSITPLHNEDPSHPQLHVHLTNLALQSGVTRFLEQPPLINSTQDDVISITLSESNAKQAYHHQVNKGNQYEPLVLPGDANHPALTIYPKPPTPSDSPTSKNTLPDKRSFANPTWIYDKTPDSPSFRTNSFWSQFDFVIVQDPAQVVGAFAISSEIQSLGSPILIRPGQDIQRRYTPQWTTPDELWAYWTSAPTAAEQSMYQAGGGTTALLQTMYPTFISVPLTRLHDLAHDVLRLGIGPFSISLTGGYWLEIPLQTSLYIMQNTASMRDPVAIAKSNDNKNDPIATPIPTNGNANSDETREDHIHLLPSKGAHPAQPQLDWDDLGPLVVNKDGTLSRLNNWAQMNAQERKRTVEYLKKRNLLRMEGEGGIVA